MWQDTRTAELVAAYARDGGQDRFRARTGLPLATYFSGLKLRWLLDNVPGARAKAAAGDALFGTIDTWLLWNLTGGSAGGVHLTDVTNASRTQLIDLTTLDWDDELLAAFDVPRALLPRIAPSSASYGAAQIAALHGVPIAGILGDQQAALVGQTCFEPGEAKNTYGTGCFMLMNTGQQIVPSTAGLVTTVAYQFGDEPPCYALEGSIAIAGALVQWLRDNLGLIAKSADVETLARASRGQRRRLRRAGVLGAVRAVLAGHGARRHHGAHALRESCATSRARRSKPSRIRRATCSKPWRRTPASRSRSCASTAAWSRTSS